MKTKSSETKNWITIVFNFVVMGLLIYTIVLLFEQQHEIKRLRSLMYDVQSNLSRDIEDAKDDVQSTVRTNCY